MNKLQLALSIISGRTKWKDINNYKITILGLEYYDYDKEMTYFERDKETILETCEKIVYNEIEELKSLIKGDDDG